MKGGKVKTTTRRKGKRKVRAVSRRVRFGTHHRLPSGHTLTMGGLVVPENSVQPVKPSKMQAGLKSASKDINNLLVALGDLLPGSFSIKEIELALSFTADGKFLGFGIGGATTITVKVAPD